MSLFYSLIIFVAFYDPDGYFFDEEGYDEFGGFYDKGFYVPGEKNKHEFDNHHYDYYDEDDELVRQYERGH